MKNLDVSGILTLNGVCVVIMHCERDVTWAQHPPTDTGLEARHIPFECQAGFEGRELTSIQVDSGQSQWGS